ncbi:MAG: fasciclin domain-containing protein [Bacteroidaceae bacterium]|nr:fasciclin domain-containing protein [Bacteroidaceae bacterium]
MKVNITKWLTGSLMTVALATAVTSCQDDHFKIDSAVMGNQTIWQNIVSNPQLSDYAEILQNVYYSQTEEKASTETYAAMLNSDQTFTVWAPVNGSFDKAYYMGLLKSGIRDSIFKVEKELVRNNMTRFSHIINGKDSVKFELFNSKVASLNFSNGTFMGKKMVTSNIGATNGVLHITEAPATYQYNMYEFLSSRQGQLDSISAFIKKFEKNEFNEELSTQGPTVNSQITWVDSITNLTNDFLYYGLNAYLNREDSNYVMIVPTNKAWEEKIEDTKKYFHFKSSYKQKVNTTNERGDKDQTDGPETVFTDLEVDSLNNYYAKKALCENLIFNANWQYEQIPISSIADIRAADARGDSLQLTNRIKLKKTGTLNETNKLLTKEIDSFADMFGNNDPVETSNGHAYLIDSYAFPVIDTKKDYSAFSVYDACDQHCTEIMSPTTVVNENPIVIIDGDTVQTDSIYKNSYVIMENKNSSSNPGAYFILPDVLSCKYDIYVVLGYCTKYDRPNKFRAYIAYDTEAKRIDNETLKNPNEDAVDPNGASLYNTNYFVNRPPHYNEKGEVTFNDTICIARDFEFPVSYYGLPNNYPMIQIKSNFTSKESAIYCREIWVNAVILKTKGHDD